LWCLLGVGSGDVCLRAKNVTIDYLLRTTSKEISAIRKMR
jgi:hypothetical protein